MVSLRLLGSVNSDKGIRRTSIRPGPTYTTLRLTDFCLSYANGFGSANILIPRA